ncbi:MAG: hypothetical protein GF317_04475 [Candidatus Lokiarchaeota archaeon]|nr:hypothetical protein [Candidatus Lokiarchaeota archaeon]MBD3199145.1 hypothetical protein [Candidatus Lokiarchaeota archaeon]
MVIMVDPKEVLELIKSRRSIRCFSDDMIPDDQINMILEAGKWAPTASNRQEVRFLVIKDKDILNKLSETAIYGKFVREAPILIAIIGKTHENPNWYVQDTSLASMNMMLMAWSLDIGTCWIGSMDRKAAKQILNLKKDDFLLTILPFGYLRKDIPNPPPRKELEDITKKIE